MSKINLRELDDTTLAGLREDVTAEVERRRPKLTLEDIKPGMSKEETARAFAEIRRVLGEGQ